MTTKLTITTKCNVGEELFAHRGTKLVPFTVEAISWYVRDDGSYFYYTGKTHEGEEIMAFDGECFTSRQEFINQL